MDVHNSANLMRSTLCFTPLLLAQHCLYCTLQGIFKLQWNKNIVSVRVLDAGTKKQIASLLLNWILFYIIFLIGFAFICLCDNCLCRSKQLDITEVLTLTVWFPEVSLLGLPSLRYLEMSWVRWISQEIPKSCFMVPGPPKILLIFRPLLSPGVSGRSYG